MQMATSIYIPFHALLGLLGIGLRVRRYAPIFAGKRLNRLPALLLLPLRLNRIG
jgi:hypothetical protein